MFIPTIPRHIIEGVMQSDPAPPPLPPPPPLIDAELPPFTVAEPPALSIPTDSSNPGSPLDPDESFSPYNHPSLDSPVYTAFSRSLSDVTSPQDASTSTSTNPFHQLLIQNASPASHSSPDLAHPRPTIATAELRAASLLAYDSPLPSPGPSPGPIPSSSPCLSSDSERNSIQWPSATSAPSGPLESSGTGASGTPDQMAAVSAATSIEPAPFFFSLFPLPPSGPASHSTTPVASPSSTATV
ncbi:hypothetical protein BOTBODRAFT_572267 [Botryobasidium botryosum FD-172 SS1]|uniref:Uncharacterized protein n=1 Tax=Botryobasidium botryosum (strain FD-172 SS1) TaxID=930990 RepID=A0A067LY43_BOTB1|nr:hypothetical protein BOTBODRAFT_572267 [Botryobasidium botryosum FD-172 SS1]